MDKQSFGRISLIDRAKIQAEVLVPVLKAFRPITRALRAGVRGIASYHQAPPIRAVLHERATASAFLFNMGYSINVLRGWFCAQSPILAVSAVRVVA
jgi:hypothetical protein